MKIDHQQIKDQIQSVIRIEYDALKSLYDSIDDTVAFAIEILAQVRGKVVVTGIGKSAIIAQKMAATFNSTGTPSVFLHAADALHGDLGIIREEDAVICISKSGNSPEIKNLIPHIKSFGVPIIGFVSQEGSYLHQEADYPCLIPISREADPNNLAPTASTTSQLVLGDALAIVLQQMRGFTAADFAVFHPGGHLGKSILSKVSAYVKADRTPIVSSHDKIQQVIIQISTGRLGATAVANEKGEIIGIITDGDLRRMLAKYQDFHHLSAMDIATLNPRIIAPDLMALDAFQIMKEYSITQLLVVHQDKYLGMIHIHDLIQAGFGI